MYGFHPHGYLPRIRVETSTLGWRCRSQPRLTATGTPNKQQLPKVHQRLVRQWCLTAVDRYLDPEFINRDPPLPGSPDGRRHQAAERSARAFPDWRSDVSTHDRRGCSSWSISSPQGPPRLGDGWERRRDSTSCCVASTSSGSSTADRRSWGRLDILGSCNSSGLRHNKPRLHRVPDQAATQFAARVHVGSASMGPIPNERRSLGLVAGLTVGGGCWRWLRRRRCSSHAAPSRLREHHGLRAW